MSNGDFDEWKDGRPIIEEGADDFDEWKDAQPLLGPESGTTTTTTTTTSTTTTTYPQWYTDFSEYSTGSPPSDWTEEWSTSPAEDIETNSGFGSKQLNIDHSTAVYFGYSWDDVGDITDVDVLMRVRANTSGGQHAQRIMIRGAGTTSTRTGYFAYINPNTNTYGVHEYNSGASTSIDSGSATIDHDTWYWMRFRAQGTSLKFRYWEGPYTHEPDSWDIDATDSTVSAAGWVGVSSYSSDTDMDIDYFAVAEGGGTAPYPQDDPFTTTTSSTTSSTSSSTASTSSTTETSPPSEGMSGTIVIVATV